MNFVVMGIDRIGKNTFIDNVLRMYDPSLTEIHLSKPPEGEDPLIFSKTEYAEYFTSLQKKDHLVYNRGHIDEFVYGPLYREQNTYWLKIYEQEFADDLDNTVFILLFGDNGVVLEDDGKSIDYSRRMEEQDLFLQHFQESRVHNKMLIKTVNREGYRSVDDIRADFEQKLKQMGR